MVEQVGRYKIKGQLGRGAMGVVYLADDPLLNRQAAIKTVDLASDDEQQREFLRGRLLRDARAAAGLTHPNIVGVFDVVEEGDAAYLVMEYVAGETLAAVLNRTAIPDAPYTIHVLRDMAAALDYTHARGVVHRDIKPANVMIDTSQTAKIMDFGIARIADTRTTTPTGMVMGTIEYMSPEQVKGETVDGRSDQFALAAVAYRMLTGATLFGQHTLATLAYKIVNEAPVAARMRNAGLPASVDSVMSRALAKLPQNRFLSCTEFVDALAAALSQPRREEPTLTMPLPTAAPVPASMSRGTVANASVIELDPSKKGRGAAIAVAVVLLVGAGSGLAIWRPWEKPPIPTGAHSPTESQPAVLPPTSNPPKPEAPQPVTATAVPNKPQPPTEKKPQPTTPVEPDETSTGQDNATGDPTPPLTPKPAVEAYRHGLDLLNSNQVSAAIDSFNKAISIRPEWANPYYDRGRANQRMNDFAAAIKDYDQSLRIRPRNALAHANRGICYLRLKDDDRALEDFTSALVVRPELATALYGRGMVRMHRASYRGALDDFNAAIRNSPNYSMAYTARGNTKRKLGDEAGALADFKKARELNGH